jgi:hypothetical protein
MPPQNCKSQFRAFLNIVFDCVVWDEESKVNSRLRSMKCYKFTLTYPDKKTSSMDNKIGPLVRKCKGTFESKFNFENNETIVVVTIEKKEDKTLFEKTLEEDPHYSFLTLEKVVLTLDDD